MGGAAVGGRVGGSVGTEVNVARGCVGDEAGRGVLVFTTAGLVLVAVDRGALVAGGTYPTLGNPNKETSLVRSTYLDCAQPVCPSPV